MGLVQGAGGWGGLGLGASGRALMRTTLALRSSPARMTWGLALAASIWAALRAREGVGAGRGVTKSGGEDAAGRGGAAAETGTRGAGGGIGPLPDPDTGRDG